jgi:hypothetical protein
MQLRGGSTARGLSGNCERACDLHIVILFTFSSISRVVAQH